MLRLTYKITSLPDLSLDTAQIQQVASTFNLISDDDLATTESFNLSLQEKIQPALAQYFWPATYTRIIAYLRSWHRLGSSLVAYNNKIADEWQKVTGAPMAADAFVPLMIALLPNHPARIKQMHDKIDFANKLGCIYKHGYAYATLGIALAYKLAPASAKDIDPDAAMIQKVAEHLREMDNIYLINHLRKTCLTFKQTIIDAIEQHIKNNDKFAYQYFRFDLDKEQALLEMIHHDDDEAISITNINDCQPALDLYLRVLYDFLGTLNRQLPSNDILLEFAEKIYVFYYEYKRQQLMQTKTAADYLPSFFQSKPLPSHIDLLPHVYPLATYIKEEYHEQKTEIIHDQSEPLRNTMTSTI